MQSVARCAAGNAALGQFFLISLIQAHLPTSCPAREILGFALGRIPCLVT
jgi:hypothetical protein